MDGNINGNAIIFEYLSIEKQAEVDSLIFNGRRLESVKVMKDQLGIGLMRAVEVLYWRFEILNESSKKKFTCNPDTYWDGFNTL